LQFFKRSEHPDKKKQMKIHLLSLMKKLPVFLNLLPPVSFYQPRHFISYPFQYTLPSFFIAPYSKEEKILQY
jgi:hypothetical protein